MKRAQRPFPAEKTKKKLKQNEVAKLPRYAHPIIRHQDLLKRHYFLYAVHFPTLVRSQQWVFTESCAVDYYETLKKHLDKSKSPTSSLSKFETGDRLKLLWIAIVDVVREYFPLVSMATKHSDSVEIQKRYFEYFIAQVLFSCTYLSKTILANKMMIYPSMYGDIVRSIFYFEFLTTGKSFVGPWYQNLVGVNADVRIPLFRLIYKAHRDKALLRMLDWINTVINDFHYRKNPLAVILTLSSQFKSWLDNVGILEYFMLKIGKKFGKTIKALEWNSVWQYEFIPGDVYWSNYNFGTHDISFRFWDTERKSYVSSWIYDRRGIDYI